MRLDACYYATTTSGTLLLRVCVYLFHFYSNPSSITFMMVTSVTVGNNGWVIGNDAVVVFYHAHGALKVIGAKPRFPRLFVCWVFCFQSQNSNRFLRWLQSLPVYLFNTRKRDSHQFTRESFMVLVSHHYKQSSSIIRRNHLQGVSSV